MFGGGLPASRLQHVAIGGVDETVHAGPTHYLDVAPSRCIACHLEGDAGVVLSQVLVAHGLQPLEEGREPCVKGCLITLSALHRVTPVVSLLLREVDGGTNQQIATLLAGTTSDHAEPVVLIAHHFLSPLHQEAKVEIARYVNGVLAGLAVLRIA